MGSDSSNTLTRYVSATTIVTARVANSWFGGLHGTEDESLYVVGDPLIDGHVHDGVRVDGHAQKINLVDHVTDQLLNVNLADDAVTPRNVKAFTNEENAIPYITSDGKYKLNFTMFDFGAFIEVSGDNLIRTRHEGYGVDGYDFVFGSSSLDDIGSGAAGVEDGDSRVLFDRDLSAFRAGLVSDASSDYWDESFRGEYSVAMGMNVLAAGSGSVSLGIGNISYSSKSSILGGLNNIISDSEYSFIGGGEDNEIGDGVHSFIGGGKINRSFGQSSVVGGGFTNNVYCDYSVVGGGSGNNIRYTSSPSISYSCIGGGLNNAVTESVGSTVAGGGFNTVSDAEYAQAGGMGVAISSGVGSFAWGYDASGSPGSSPITGDKLFVIGTGSDGEGYKLGVNTNNPTVTGDMGAEIVGVGTAGTTPLRLTGLQTLASTKGLCVDDATGDVFISDYSLGPLTDPEAVVFDPPIYKYKQYTMDVLPISSPYHLDDNHVLTRNERNFYLTQKSVGTGASLAFAPSYSEKSEPGALFRPLGESIPYAGGMPGCNDPSSYTRYTTWPVVSMGSPSDPVQYNNIKWVFPIFDGLRLYKVRVGVANDTNSASQQDGIPFGEQWTCSIYSLEANTICPPEDTYAPDYNHYDTDVMPGFSSESIDDAGNPCGSGGVVDYDTYNTTGVCENGGGIIMAATFNFTGANGHLVDKPGLHVASLTYDGYLNNLDNTELRYVCWIEMIYEVETLVAALECSTSGSGIL